ncbi:DUF4065 domain-containing protein [Collinsella sp. AGMB00827]|uniref:DUF4065 domain-containing protein n=1 Tax=Collinsella ureilytica TaxID=2869515 RepID=A0ABS7MJV9_9ACTN|nr:type II toxin-antitoxin system antitoxin SocA domain-containing protein [Collinsella urealyticum]MBY4797655.1 DUF4065 domain-containing protein [Collinsella urealyticum]
MRAIEVANFMIVKFGQDLQITNLKLNKLLYYAQVEQLRRDGTRLFSDDIEAWTYGPVVPSVYQAFKHYRRDVISNPIEDVAQLPASVILTIEHVANTYGKLSTFDLVEFSHREAGAWNKVYSNTPGATISVEDILASDDANGLKNLGNTVEEDIQAVISSIPNALRLLANS